MWVVFAIFFISTVQFRGEKNQREEKDEESELINVGGEGEHHPSSFSPYFLYFFLANIKPTWLIVAIFNFYNTILKREQRGGGFLQFPISILQFREDKIQRAESQ